MRYDTQQITKTGEWVVIDKETTEVFDGNEIRGTFVNVGYAVVSKQDTEEDAKQKADELNEREFWRENKLEIAIVLSAMLPVPSSEQGLPDSEWIVSAAGHFVTEIVRRGEE